MEGSKEQFNFSSPRLNQPSRDDQNTPETYVRFIQGAPQQPWIFSPQNIPPPAMTPGMRTPHMSPNIGMTPQHRPFIMDGFYPPRDPRHQRYPAAPFHPHGRPPLRFDQPSFGQQQHSFPLIAPVQPMMRPSTQWGFLPPHSPILNPPCLPFATPPLFGPSNIAASPIIRPLNFTPPGTPSWSRGDTIMLPPAPSPRGIAQRMGVSDDGSVCVSMSHDDPFISDWLRIVGLKHEHQRQQEERERSQHRVKIMEAQQLFSRASVLLSRLSSAHQQLSALSSNDIIKWREITSQVNLYKEELGTIRGRLESGDGLEQLVRKVEKRKKRRMSMKLRLREGKADRDERRTRAEEVTEKWLTDKRQAELKAKTEKSVQTAASGVLNEVKQKQSELQKYLKLVPALQKLREFRREALKRKGEFHSIEVDEKFSESCESLLDLLTRQSRVYEDEERALRVLMEEEVQEKMSSQRRRDKSGQHEAVTAVTVSNIVDPRHQADTSDTIMEPFRRYYLQAEQNEECLTAVRSQWDHFLSPLGAPISCSLDNPTLLPPSSNEWSQYIIHPVQ